MKKWLAFVLLVLNGSLTFAQKTVAINPLTDSARAKWGKIKIVEGAAMISSNDIIENMALSKEYSVLLKAIDEAGLTQTFKSKGPITVFAPTNQAFNKLPAGALDSLLNPSHRLDLENLLTYHAVVGIITARDIQRKINANNGQATYRTIAGNIITARIDSNRNIVLTDENGGESIVSKFDVKQSNGMLHVVTSVLVPKTKVI
jgi:uncharacterized surface protein with fasciclin (FAS1) repeats